MDNNSIIDKKTFDVCINAEDHPDVFICDKLLAESISELNKKGYSTYASCSGHYRIEFYEYFNEDIKNLEEFKNNDRIIIKNINKSSFDYWEEVDFTETYILFSKKYIFNTLPINFYIDNDESRTCIRCKINYYDSSNKRKTVKEIVREIEDNCNNIRKWVEELPYINK